MPEKGWQRAFVVGLFATSFGLSYLRLETEIDVAAAFKDADWGSVPAWFGAVSTFVAILGLGLAWRSERRDNEKLRQEQAEREVDLRREHARRRGEAASRVVLTVTQHAFPHRTAGMVTRKLRVENFGEQPIFKLELMHRDQDGALIASLKPAITFAGKRDEVYEFGEPETAKAHHLDRYELHFVDHQALRWVRTADGGLEDFEDFLERMEVEQWERAEAAEQAR